MDYKKHFDDFVRRIENELEQKELYESKVEQLNSQHTELLSKLDKLMSSIDKGNETVSFLDNTRFIELMNISKRTAQQWRDTNTIAYSQIGNKIYYHISDIHQLLKDNYIKALRKENNDE